MWHDNETTVDYINFNLVAQACANLIRDADGAPISIGISGGWGAGKSSLVRMVEVQLCTPLEATKSKYAVVTFNPWLYQGFEDARTALLQIVGDAVLAKAASDQTLATKAHSLIKRINFMRLIQLGGEVAATLITGVPVGLLTKAVEAGATALQGGSASDGIEAAKSLPAAAKGLLNEAKPISLPQEIQAFRESLEELLQELDITLVIFVDDLDRCLPKTAIATLEAIRLLLFLKRSAFVIAADNDFIRGAVKVHFAGTGINDDISTNYLDKLIQVPLRVPRLGANETKAFIALLLLEYSLKKRKLESARFDTAIKMVIERLRESWNGKSVDLNFLESLVPQGNTELLGLMGLAERLAPLLLQASSIQANPRLVKRFLNTVFMRQALAEPQGITVDVHALAKWHLLERCDEPLANAIADKVSADSEGRVQMLRDAEAAMNEPGSKLSEPFMDQPFVREWLQLLPKLGDFDLRPVLHLSRDSTIRDFGSDELNQQGKELRDTLATARTLTETLKDQIRAAGEMQAIIAMTRAWDSRSSTRTWQKAEDVVMLQAVCNQYPAAGSRAATLLANAPKAKLAPAFIPTLLACEWAKDVLAAWTADANTSNPVKRAIAQGAK